MNQTTSVMSIIQGKVGEGGGGNIIIININIIEN